MEVFTPHFTGLLTAATNKVVLKDAVYQVFTDYLELKIALHKRKTTNFELKWKMDFDNFKKSFRKRSDGFSYEIEQEFYDWEASESLKKHYQEIQAQWR